MFSKLFIWSMSYFCNWKKVTKYISHNLFKWYPLHFHIKSWWVLKNKDNDRTLSLLEIPLQGDTGCSFVIRVVHLNPALPWQQWHINGCINIVWEQHNYPEECRLLIPYPHICYILSKKGVCLVEFLLLLLSLKSSLLRIHRNNNQVFESVKHKK